jgi:CheY-like chemotaxis protein
MNTAPIHLLLADDDADDCSLFQDALEELPLATSLTTVHNGEQLMQLLSTEAEELPQILFLDLNMPRKNGFECLSEIRLNKNLQQLPVIIFSTSFDHDIVNLLYKNGAQYYIRKPADFARLKEVIYQAVTLAGQATALQPAKEKFILQS